MTSTALQVLLALALLQGTAAFAPRRSPAASAALKPRARAQTARPATTLEQRPAAAAAPGRLPQMRPDEAFTGVVECPFTAWGAGNDVNLEAERAIPSGEFAPEWQKADLVGADGTLEDELNYFRSLRSGVKAQLHETGAVVLRGFELTKTADGFQQMYLALGLEPCDDPLQSVAARDAVDKSKGIYEAVNKESRSKYFVGMHNEQVGNRSPARAAFVCLKAADAGGEFLLADGRQMLRETELLLLQELYEKKVRFIAAEIPLEFMDGVHPAVRRFLEPPLLSFATTMAKQKVDFDIDLVWDQDNEGKPCIHAIAPAQPPVVRHPETNQPLWFCNMHSHSDVLRAAREARDGTLDLSETTGASRLNRTDMRFGDLSKLTPAQLAAFDDTVMGALKWVKMQPGDVVLLDNYMCMHGRNVFDGVRKHAVTWFK